MPFKDPLKRKEYLSKYMRETWYPKNKLQHLENLKIREQKLHTYILELKKESVCLKCGFPGKKYPFVLDFHHIGNKNFNIGAFDRHVTSLKTLQKEIDKCEILCANCHRIKTHAKTKYSRILRTPPDRG